MELRMCNPLRHLPHPSNYSSKIRPSQARSFSVRSCRLDPNESHKLVLEVKEKLEKDHQSLSVGKNGRDDEDLILWFLKDRKFSVQDTVEKLTRAILVLEVKEKLEKDHQSLSVGKNGRDDEDLILWFLKDRKFSVQDTVEKLTRAIKWREEFGVSELSQESVKSIAETGKAYVHDFLDVHDRPVLIVDASKHFPAVHDPAENEKLCVFLIEKALSALPEGKEEILGIFDLRGFGTENSDLKFITFLFDVFYYYYPKRLGQVLFVEAPFIFEPIWQLAKPLLKSYASVVRFCSVETVRNEYFTEATVPAKFRD